MVRTPISAALLLILPLALVPAACGDRGKDRDALRSEESTRDLNLALQGDTPTATFQDTALTQTPSAERAPEAQPQPAPAPRRSPRPAPQRYVPPPRPRPAPQREPAPVAEAPAPAAASESPGPSSATIGTGAQFAVTLNQTLGTDRNQAGDAFSATVEHAVLGDDGQVVIPAGATVHGRVTAVEKSDHVGEAAVIRLAFESITIGGRTYPFQATVVDANPRRVTRNTVGRTVERAAAGAAAGAILGKIFGKSTTKGAIIGAAAGTAIAMGTADVDAVLQEGSRVVIRTDSPVTVARR